MFLQSSTSIKSKILTAAIEADQEYRRLRAELEKGINLPDTVRNNQKI
jgi:hypothetical protein